MANKIEEITIENVESNGKVTDTLIPPSPMVNLTKPTQIKKITDSDKIESLETIINSLKTSITQLERLVDG